MTRERLEFPTIEQAQAFADSVHVRMIASVPHYATSVAGGHTTAWAVPYQDVDDGGTPISSSWYVNVKARCRPVMTSQELTRRRT